MGSRALGPAPVPPRVIAHDATIPLMCKHPVPSIMDLYPHEKNVWIGLRTSEVSYKPPCAPSLANPAIPPRSMTSLLTANALWHPPTPYPATLAPR